ncbi:MAG: hypothetical protein JRL30_06925 [Deltaproteobacteria bacterium]|nr:hypothetical protein [Deltaproteobacteria bacterium]
MANKEFASLESRLKGKGIFMHEAKKAVCVPLSKRIDIGFVPKSGWSRYPLCRRQLTWFNPDCPYYGRILVISSNKIEEIDANPDITISEHKLKRPKLLDRTEQLRLIERKSYQQTRPKAWEDISGQDNGFQEKWIKIMGIRGITYDELFITHCANHANFLEPAHFIKEDGQIVPYSIAKTTHICSACLEIFNIIGSQFKKKLVVPCPGAVLFAGMASNRYYEVVQSQ